MIDVDHAVIVDVEATPARTYDEVAATRTMIERTEKALGIRPERLTADTAYGTGKLLAWHLDKDVTPHIPVRESYQPMDGMFPRTVYVYPNGNPLKTTGTIHDGRVRNYLSQPQECRVCNLKESVHASAVQESHTGHQRRSARLHSLPIGHPRI